MYISNFLSVITSLLASDENRFHNEDCQVTSAIL